MNRVAGQSNGAPPSSIRIAGVDLAWGERRPDGVCVLCANRGEARVTAIGLTRGDEELIGWLEMHLGRGPALVMIDAPLVCPNPTGTRPVDRLTHMRFGRYFAGCHPANATKCPRPPRVAARLIERGFRIGWDFAPDARLVAEVYPHPAMVRMFDLSERIPYKRGPVVERRRQFRRLQQHLRACLATAFPRLRLNRETQRLLAARWTKDVEDQLDGFFCALLGYHHWLHAGRRTEVLGDCDTGFILLPAEGF